MINYYKTINNQVQEIPRLEKDCWIAVTEPSEEEASFLISELGVRPDFMLAALDSEETSHVKQDDTQTLIIVDSPVAENSEKVSTASFYTLPVSFILFKDHLITISQHHSPLLKEIANNGISGIDTSDELNFVLKMLYRLVGRYIYFLRQIDSLASQSEQRLLRATKNKEIAQILNLQKSLVYFSASLASTKSTLDMIHRGKNIPLSEDDLDLLEDTKIEINQAIEQANIYSNILTSTMDALGSIISNNMNVVMKIMTAITIVMTVPNMVFGFYGMNVELPLAHISAPMIITVVLMAIIGFWLYKRGFFGK